MATVRIKLRNSSVPGRAGSVYYQITHRQKSVQITTGYKLLPAEWDGVRQCVAPVLLTGGDYYLRKVQRAIDSDLSVLKNAIGALERAASFGVESAVVSRKDYADSAAFDAALLDTLQSHNIDVVVLAGFLSVLGEKVIAAYRNKIINVHPSLIPSFCGPGFYGLKVHEAALARGVKLTGATVHLVNEECDGGPILLQKAVAVQPGDTPEVLQKRVMVEAEWKLLPQALAMVCSDEV